MIRHLARIPGFRKLWRKFPVGPVQLKTDFDIWNRPHYAYGVLSAAQQAKALGMSAITAIEFGVAGGAGLLALESIAQEIGPAVGISIQAAGFDTGTGMPPPLDYRDVAHVWAEGFYKMDVDLLKSRLKTAELLLGPVADTIPAFLGRTGAVPVGFIAFDLDYYSSTREAFRIFDGSAESRLPRVLCYFDDLVYPERACHNDYIGELAAIREYNEEHARRKIAAMPHLVWTRYHRTLWPNQMYVHHDFEHALYTKLITPLGAEHTHLPLRG